MYGIFNAAIEDFVVSKYGRPKWDAIRVEAGIEAESFARMEPYPDELTYKLVRIASGALGLTSDETWRGVGQCWVTKTGREAYGALFDQAGRNLREFLYNLDNLHTRVGASLHKLRPPSFRFDEIDDESMVMHYHPGVGNRVGLCPLVEGMLAGLAAHFQTELTIEHTRCSRTGAPHCEWLLTSHAA